TWLCRQTDGYLRWSPIPRRQTITCKKVDVSRGQVQVLRDGGLSHVSKFAVNEEPERSPAQMRGRAQPAPTSTVVHSRPATGFSPNPSSASTTAVPAQISPSRWRNLEQPATSPPTRQKPNPSTSRRRFRIAEAANAFRPLVRVTRIPTIALSSVAPKLASSSQM